MIIFKNRVPGQFAFQRFICLTDTSFTVLFLHCLILHQQFCPLKDPSISSFLVSYHDSCNNQIHTESMCIRLNSRRKTVLATKPNAYLQYECSYLSHLCCLHDHDETEKPGEKVATFYKDKALDKALNDDFLLIILSDCSLESFPSWMH